MFKFRTILMIFLALLLFVLPACNHPADTARPATDIQAVAVRGTISKSKTLILSAVITPPSQNQTTPPPLVVPTQTQPPQVHASQTPIVQNPIAATLSAAIQAAATEVAFVPPVITQTVQIPATSFPMAATIAAVIPAAATEAAEVVPVSPTLGLIETLRQEGSFSLLIQALQVTNLINELEYWSPLTLFAPTDEAFNSLPAQTRHHLFDNPDILKETLLYHVIKEPMGYNQLIEQTMMTHENGTPIYKLATFQSDTVTIADFGEKLKINNGTIIHPQMRTYNGSIIHPIDMVLQSVAFTEPAVPPGLIEDIEVWRPYEKGRPLPIGDAQLVPGAPAMRNGLRTLVNVLKSNNVQINTARTVVLEEEGEIAYLAPVAFNPDQASMQGVEEAIIGVIVVQGRTNLSAGVGAYALQVTSQSENNQNVEVQQQISLLNATGDPIRIPNDGNNSTSRVEQVRIIPQVNEGNLVSAALFYGSRYCRIWNVCWQCDFFGPLGPYPTLQACADSFE